MILLTLILSTSLIALIALVFITRSLFRYIVNIRNLRNLPGPPSTNFLIGNVSPLYGPPERWFKTLREWALEYYPLYQNWAFHEAVVNILNPDDVETVLSSSKHMTKSKVYKMLRNWLGTGLLTSNGAKWQSRRKILTSAFHFNILQDFIKVFNEETKNLVVSLKKECHKPFIDITEHISAFTLNTIAETAMGTRVDDNTAKGSEYKNAVHRMGEILNYRIVRPWLINPLIYFFSPNCHRERNVVKTMHRFTSDVIANHQKNFKASNQSFTSYSQRKRLAMLDLLLNVKNEYGLIDDDGIREEVDTFMFEGHDTTAAAICFALMLIACHRDVQDRIVEEMHQVFSDATTPDYKTLQELKYMEMCIKEVLRMYPSVPFIARVLGENMTTSSGHHLEAGTMIHLHIYDLHHNPKFYPNPDKFDPDRFLPEMCQNRHTFAYVPFSAGPRNCIGQRFAMLELKAVLCGILNEFILEPVDTPSTVIMKSEMVLRTSKGIRVRFVPRTKKTTGID